MKEIGGYIELEFLSKGSYLKNALAINSARNGIKYAIRAFDIRELYVPYYTCPVVWQAISDEKCKILFYKINKNLLPEEKLPNNAYILYTN